MAAAIGQVELGYYEGSPLKPAIYTFESGFFEAHVYTLSEDLEEEGVPKEYVYIQMSVNDHDKAPTLGEALIDRDSQHNFIKLMLTLFEENVSFDSFSLRRIEPPLEQKEWLVRRLEDSSYLLIDEIRETIEES